MISLLLKDALVGFSIAAPVGPIGVLCIQLTLVPTGGYLLSTLSLLWVKRWWMRKYISS